MLPLSVSCLRTITRNGSRCPLTRLCTSYCQLSVARLHAIRYLTRVCNIAVILCVYFRRARVSYIWRVGARENCKEIHADVFFPSSYVLAKDLCQLRLPAKSAMTQHHFYGTLKDIRSQSGIVAFQFSVELHVTCLTRLLSGNM